MTFAQIQADCLDLLGEIVGFPLYTVAKLKGYINRGNQTFVRKTKALETSVDITTVANQFEYDSSDAATLVNISMPYMVRYVDGTEMGRALKPYPGGITNLPKEYSYGTPYYYWVRNVHADTVTAPAAYTGIRIGTWPICSTADKTIRVYGFVRPATLVGDSDEPEIHIEWHDALVFYAVSRMFGMFGHLRPAWEKKSMFYMSEFERMVEEARSFMAVQSDEPVETEDIYWQMDEGADY